MQENSFDNTRLLSNLRHFHKLSVRITIVLVDHTDHPARRGGDVILIVVFVKKLNLATSYGDIDDTDLDFFRCVGYQCSAKIISGCQAGIAPAQGRYSRIPLTFDSAPVFTIQSR